MYYERTGSFGVVQAEDIQATGRVLVVDDDVSFGGFAVAALESRGHDVVWAGTVSDALATLFGRSYDVVILDLRLPDGSGLDLLRQASDAGLLTGSAAVILTGCDFEEPCDIRVFHKPLDSDLDPFLDRIGHIVAITKHRRGVGANGRRTTGRSSGHGSASSRSGARVELVLYTSASSEKCQRALTTVQRVLREYEPEQVQFVVRDLAGNPEAGDEDAVIFTPTLVKRGPGARTYIVGNLDDPRLVTDLLDVNGVKRRRDFQ
jgi:CheY-like chemotaxis protein